MTHVLVLTHFPRTLFRRGFAAFAFPLAFRVLDAKIAPASFSDTPSFRAIFPYTALNPGCFPAMSRLHPLDVRTIPSRSQSSSLRATNRILVSSDERLRSIHQIHARRVASLHVRAVQQQDTHPSR